MTTIPHALDAYVQDYAWHESCFAPRLQILQALTPCGRTASGIGQTRPQAYNRCFAEVAEILALRLAGGAQALGFDPRRDGIAAHPDAKTARLSALIESHERQAVSAWWQGQRPAQPIADDWLASTGVAAQVAADRTGSAQKRPCQFWLLAAQGGLQVVVCRSTSQHGQEPILGYGCHPFAAWAAIKALREALLMEVNLMTLQFARSTGTLADHTALSGRIATYGRRLPDLLPQGPGITPAADVPVSQPPLDGMRLRDLTTADSPMPVWLCQSDTPLPLPGTGDGSAYL